MAKKRQEKEEQFNRNVQNKVESDLASVINKQDSTSTIPNNNLSFDDYSSKIDELNKSYAPKLETPQFDKERYAELEAKKRKRKWMDIAYGVAKGLGGGQVTSGELPTARYGSQQQQMLQQYKDVVQKNKAMSDAWNKAMYENKMKFLFESYKKAKTPEEKSLYEQKIANEEQNRALRTRELDLREREIEAKKAGGYYKKGTRTGYEPINLQEGEHKLEGSYPYTKILQSLDPEAVNLLPEKSTGEEYTPSEMENAASQIILQMYDIKYDDRGRQYLAPKEGSENFISNLRGSLEKEKKLAPIERKLKAAKKQLEDMGSQGTASYEIFDSRKRANLEAEIKNLEAEKQSITGGNKSQQEKTSNKQPQESNQSQQTTDFQSLINKYKK